MLYNIGPWLHRYSISFLFADSTFQQARALVPSNNFQNVFFSYVNIRLGWDFFDGTNALAYWNVESTNKNEML